MTQLLFNCDDFGKTHEANAAIVKAHTEGVLGSTSLMVTGEVFDEAVQIAKSYPPLRVGLHLALSEARSALSPQQVSQLVNETGHFHSDPARNGIRIAFSKEARKQAALEIEAQFRKFVSTGLKPAHIDGHHHLHMHPFIFKECVKWAERFGFQRIRIANEFGNPLPPRNSRESIPKMVRHFIFRALSNSAIQSLKHSSLQHFDGVLGLWESGRMNEEYLLKAIPQLPPGTWEIYSHVGSEGCEEELPALLSQKLRKLIADLNVEIL